VKKSTKNKIFLGREKIMNAKTLKKFFVLVTIVLVFLSACGSDAKHLIKKAQATATMISAEKTAKVIVEEAMGTLTPIAPTATAIQIQATYTALPTDTPVPTAVLPTVVPTAVPVSFATIPVNQVYSSSMDGFNYTWTYIPGTQKETPDQEDAQSSGKAVSITHDLGVKVGQLTIIKGVTITVDNTTLGTPCALAVLTPGYYRNIVGTEWRWETYWLPNSNPLDPTGWSIVLAKQAMEVEKNLYGCSQKELNQIPVFYSTEVAPFGQ